MKKAIIIFLVLFSCNHKEKIPEYVIAQDAMVNIITDIHITDGLLTINNIRKKLANKDSINYYDAIFTNYGYNRTDFDTSIKFYSKNIDYYDNIYEEVLNRLNEMETNLKEEISAENKEEKDLNKKELNKKVKGN